MIIIIAVVRFSGRAPRRPPRLLLFVFQPLRYIYRYRYRYRYVCRQGKYGNTDTHHHHRHRCGRRRERTNTTVARVKIRGAKPVWLSRSHAHHPTFVSVWRSIYVSVCAVRSFRGCCCCPALFSIVGCRVIPICRTLCSCSRNSC